MVVLKQCQSHLVNSNLIEINKSAYRKNHSTETAVLSVMKELLLFMDKRLVSLVALLDLSATFDTIDHNILLSRLQSRMVLVEQFQSCFVLIYLDVLNACLLIMSCLLIVLLTMVCRRDLFWALYCFRCIPNLFLILLILINVLIIRMLTILNFQSLFSLIYFPPPNLPYCHALLISSYG